MSVTTCNKHLLTQLKSVGQANFPANYYKHRIPSYIIEEEREFFQVEIKMFWHCYFVVDNFFHDIQKLGFSILVFPNNYGLCFYIKL